MLLALDVGNTQIYGGLIEDNQIRLRFRRTSKTGASSDEIGIFLRAVLRENGFDPKVVTRIAVCSVVPEIIHSLNNAGRKYFDCIPDIINAETTDRLRFNYANPKEIGADRIVNAIAATYLFPKRDLIVIDLGTATTFCAVEADCTYHGGAIIAGLKLSIEALESRTAKLPSVEIIRPDRAVGKSTVAALQAGLYFGHLGAMREISTQLRREVFSNRPVSLVGTGGFSSLFEGAGLFDHIEPDLILQVMMRCAMD